MFGRRTSQLPTSFPIPGTSIRLPLFAPKKSVAGFTAAVVTGACITAGFFGGLAPLGVDEPAWAWGKGVLGNWAGLVLTTVVGGMAAGVSEALCELCKVCRAWVMIADHPSQTSAHLTIT